MKLGGESLIHQFESANWRAYRHNEPISIPDMKRLIGPNSIDVTLHHQILVPQFRPSETMASMLAALSVVQSVNSPYLPVDPHNPDSLSWVMGEIKETGFILPANGFVLGAVRERFVCDSPVAIDVEVHQRFACFAPMCEGRSTCGRIGLEVHLSAGFGDYGFGGAFTLELKNNLPAPIILYPGMRVAQIAFEEVYQPKRYKGAYSEENHHDGPVQPKLGPERF